MHGSAFCSQAREASLLEWLLVFSPFPVYVLISLEFLDPLVSQSSLHLLLYRTKDGNLLLINGTES